MIRMNRQHSTWSMSHDTAFSALLASGLSPEQLHAAVAAQKVEIVLTAHPTQVNRRTLQYKHMKSASAVSALLTWHPRMCMSSDLPCADSRSVCHVIMHQSQAF